MIKRLIIYFTIVTIVFTAVEVQPIQGFYFSPNSPNLAFEVFAALPELIPKMKVNATAHARDTVSYTIDNVTLDIDFNIGSQKTAIIGPDLLEVSGGKIEFHYSFNYTKIDDGKSTKGYGFGSAYSDSFVYRKTLNLDSQSRLIWEIPPKDGFNNLTLSNKMPIKRIYPFNETDFEILEKVLDGTIDTHPEPVKNQLLSQFNEYMPPILNSTLNHEVITNQTNYTFHSHTHGELNVTFEQGLFEFGITQQDGYKIEFGTKIKGQPEPECKGIILPDKHLPWEFYGGTQNIKLNCLFQHVVDYMQKQGWLDVKLNSDWECNAFQFYAGDCFDLINNLYLKVNPRQILSGECKANSSGLKFVPSMEFESNTFALTVLYECTLSSRDKSARPIDVARFEAQTRLYIRMEAGKVSMNVQIVEAQAMNMQFKPVGDFYVTNLNLALFKTNEVLAKLKKNKVFGNGYPLVPLQVPKTKVSENYTVFYDSSHPGHTLLDQ